ncbi:MAG TPA: hypothetical protein P5110_00040 [Candidatus Omnitrophota bacterium]|nr:hypothetical protein [Candidatus Omnitrophota bacterium]
MRKIIGIAVGCLLALTAVACAQDAGSSAVPHGQPKIMLLISEQNIEGPQAAWWASEINLSATEAAIARKLIEAGFEVIDPSQITDALKQDKAFRLVELNEKDSLKLAQVSRADYVLQGKAVASAGGRVPQSSMRSCFANVTVKLFRVKSGTILTYLDAAGNSAHMDVITGGKEALVAAAANLAPKIIEALRKDFPAAGGQ